MGEADRQSKKGKKEGRIKQKMAWRQERRKERSSGEREEIMHKRHKNGRKKERRYTRKEKMENKETHGKGD